MDNKALKNKVIITAAVTGAWPKKENNPNVPMTPQEIADDVYACWKAGAAVAHLHMRDDEGNGTMDTAKFDETLKLMKERYPEMDIIINLTIGCKNVEHFNSIVSRIRSIDHVRSISRGFT